MNDEIKEEFDLLYKKLNALAIEVDASIVSNIKETVNEIYNGLHTQPKVSDEDIVYVPVSVEKELPESGQKVIWQMTGGGQYEGYWDEAEGKNWVYLFDDKGDAEAFAFSDFHHWLKPVKLSSLRTPISDKQVEALAEREYPEDVEFTLSYPEGRDINERERNAFINGLTYKANPLHELSDKENIVFETAQELTIVTSELVVEYAAANGIELTKPQASRILSKLCKIGLLARNKRLSRGWGLGWHPVTYKIKTQKP